MSVLQLSRWVAATVACAGLVIPCPTLWAARPNCKTSPSQASAKRIPPVADVELDARGTLRGAVINIQGVPVTDAAIVVRQGNREVARTKTDALGYFTVTGLRGGTYLVAATNGGRLYRVWAARTAPPKTGQFALVIVGGDVVRGQVPLGSFLCCDAVLITAMAAAIVAIPLAIQDSDSPASP